MTNTQPQQASASQPTGSVSQGDVVATWVLWALLLAAMAVTYTRLETSELYNVSRDGIGGALSRMLVQLNYPIAFIAIAAVLIAFDTLRGRWWWLGGGAIAACAVTAWPGVVDDGDLDARLVNIVPALGVAGAVTLTIAATRRSGAGMAPRCRFDTGRVVIAAGVLFLSLPWLAADLGFYLPDVGFIAERPDHRIRRRRQPGRPPRPPPRPRRRADPHLRAVAVPAQTRLPHPPGRNHRLSWPSWPPTGP